MQDAWRAYLDLALGLTETSRKKATKVAKKLVGRGGATAEQLQSVAEDLVTTSLANREALTRLVRYELERALGRVGLATTEEVTALTARVRELEQELADARATTGSTAVPGSVAPAAVTPPATVRKVAKRTVGPRKAAGPVDAPRVSSTPVDGPAVDSTPVVPAPTEPPAPVVSPVSKKVVAKKVVAKKAVAEPVVAQQAVAKRAVAKKAVAKKAVAKKTVAGRVPAKKAAGTTDEP